jgi:hypothetical protein
VPASLTGHRRFRAAIEGSGKGRVYLVVPFDPAEAWGPRARYHVAGTINGCGVRGALVEFSRGFFLPLGPAWRRSIGIKIGDVVEAEIAAEGPQREALAPDIAAALDAEPEAAAFFDSLATFYRKGFLRWIDATKRSPETRAARIAEMIRMLRAGQKQRPH